MLFLLSEYLFPFTQKGERRLIVFAVRGDKVVNMFLSLRLYHNLLKSI